MLDAKLIVFIKVKKININNLHKTLPTNSMTTKILNNLLTHNKKNISI